MAHENRIITSAGTNIWFAAGGAIPAVKWNGTSPATPWTSQSTTPFEIGLNDTTGGKWTPQEAVPVDVYAGDTPLPRTTQSYPRVVETIPVQIWGTTHDAIVAALRLLKHELRSISVGAPALFVFDPDGATNAAYTEIYSASAQPNPLFINDENNQGMMRVALTIERSPFFSNLASGVTALSSGDHTNQAGSNTRNLPSSLNGDLANEGLPMNITITGKTTVKYLFRLMLASIAASASDASSAGTISGPSTTVIKGGGGFSSGANAALYAALQNNQRTRLRVIMRFSNVTANSVVQCHIEGVGYSPRIKLTAIDRVVDFGSFIPSPQRDRGVNLGVSLYLISGGPLTLVNCEVLAYYDFATVPYFSDWETPGSGGAVDAFRTVSNRVTLPLPTSTLRYTSSSVGVDFGIQPHYGTLPRAFPNAKLWLAWTTISTVDGSPNTAFTELLTTTATYAPLFLSFRGSQ